MCGIIGYIGNKNASEIVLDGLKHLEYRGYDSVGMAYILNGNLIIKKGVGNIDSVNSKLNFLELKSNIVIGHTRWATHGEVSEVNSHPHTDCNNNIAIVHNGIIENYNELKEALEKENHVFKSSTDTEVVAHLIEKYMKREKKFENACKEAVKELKGSFALLIINNKEEKIIAIRNESPLVIGIADHGYFAASDIPAFIKYTNNVVFLKNYDFVVLEKNKYKIENLFKRKIERKIEKIEINFSAIEKGSFDHYMIKEILEQKDVIEKATKQDINKLNKFVFEISKKKEIFMVSAGTSYHACLAAKYLFSKLGIIAHVFIASEFKNFGNILKKDDIVIAVSQSGETADVLDAIRFSKEKGCKIFSVVNVKGSSLERESDICLYMNAGPEIGVASTKAYIAELIIFILIYKLLSNDSSINIDEIKNKVYELLAESRREYIKKVAEKLKNSKSIFLIGRGINYVTSLEAALKIKEISYIHAEAFPGGEIKHGPIALIEKGTPCIVFLGKEKEIISNALELKSRGAFIIGVSSTNSEIFDIWIKVPEDGISNLIYQIIPMQLLAYQLAILRGFNPDRPRNLAKSVTVL
ncbi:MAG: glutamine--fructose-6-phosphate transaminase (isomerizing) [Candidatus Aenigmarchaeota archaeon]|nr:glutamine--fructose-6-phosphate transaminase (isomerizing) [Candidatus Aenigmarchaeota archaeon]